MEFFLLLIDHYSSMLISAITLLHWVSICLKFKRMTSYSAQFYGFGWINYRLCDSWSCMQLGNTQMSGSCLG